MKLKNLLSAMIVASGMAVAGSASAVPIEAIFNVAGLGAFTANTGTLTTATTITNGAPNLVGDILASNIDLSTGLGVTLAPSTLPVTVGGTFTKEFTTPYGTFLEALTVTSVNISPNALGVLAVGTIKQTAYVSGPLDFEETPVYWSAAYTQNAGPGTQINGSFNNSTTPPPPLPEPATLLLMGAGVAGFGFRRKAAV